MNLGALVARVAGLETRVAVEVVEGEEMSVRADGDQLEQLLINLVRNAADASLVTGGRVRVGWRANGTRVEIRVEDEGLGIANPANLFVPFFTTKPGGSGIGLVLCRQIAEAHGGTLALENRREGPGLSSSANLFVPFFTTKPNGSGIGLALSRQIAEAHGGTLSLGNRAAARGCVARLELPAAPKAGSA